MKSSVWLAALAALFLAGCPDDGGDDPVVDSGAGGAGGADMGAAGEGGMGGGGAGGMGGEGGMGGGVVVDLCPDYCERMAANCPGSYPDEAACLAVCALFPDDGETAATEGNSVQCRLYHAGVAMDDPDLHCPHANALGGGVCGGTCESYCSLVAQTCPGSYADDDACRKECETFPAGAADATEGDSVQCRTYHASFPAIADAGTHCPHAQADGGGVCGSYCEVYCDRFIDNCPGYYANQDECLQFCALFPTDGATNATEGNSVQCRLYHANLPAQELPDVHCPHASNTGGGVCGSYCDVYCDSVEARCDEYTQYPDRPSCLAACGAMNAEGADTAVDGNSVQCRIYHASLPASVDAATHCPHAGVTGGGACGSSPCDAYCDQMIAHCPGAYADRQGCLDACGEIPADGPWNATDGNSVQCRAYHASFPAVGDPALHCPHAGLSGSNVCGDTCEFYCDLMETNCDGSYPDRATCLDACGTFESGTPGDIAGDTIECRVYHAAYPASIDPATHCPHAGVDGAGVCVSQDPCAAYCDRMEANCDGAFPDRAACLATCALYPTDGDADARDGNSVQCRSNFALVPDGGAANCAAASSHGGGVCGGYCENYCAFATQTCQGLFADEASCLAECAAYPTDGGMQVGRGDNVQCRTHFATFPAVNDAAANCPNAGPDGNGTCGQLCGVYCNRMAENCPGTYPNRNVCMETCAEFRQDGNPNATDGDSVQCRIYHGNLPAAAVPETHCPHAGVTGSGVCGGLCDVYCTQVMDNCTGANAVYPDRAACLAACEAFPQDGADGAIAGNHVQCRIYHATAPAAADAATHCPHTSVTGASVCGDSVCAAYCDQVGVNCPNLYPSRQACELGCVEVMDAGQWDDETGNTLSCRAHFASWPAALDPAQCVNASIGSNLCR